MKLKIRNLELENNVMAAPLAGYSDLPWRMLVSEMGAGAVFSEMISAEALKRAQKRTIKMIVNDDSARPYGIQLFGSKPESFKNAIAIIKDIPFDLIDINMGCPVRKVTSRGEGSALMKDLTQAETIIKALRTVYDGPLTVKFRSGWDDSSKNAVELAKIAEGSGADAVIVHPRTRVQVFKGSADWKIIADVRGAVNIPVIGNGDVINKATADKMFSETGCDGIMIGRAAIGNPWIFRELKGFPPPTLEEKFALIRKHIDLAVKCKKDERYIVSTIRKFLPKYLKGLYSCKELFEKLNHVKSVDQALECLKFFESNFI